MEHRVRVTGRGAWGLIATLLGGLLGGGCASDFWLLPLEEDGSTMAVDLGRVRLLQGAASARARDAASAPSAGGGWWSELGAWPDAGVGDAGGVSAADATRGRALTPDARVREPRASGDVIFTEWMQDPSLTADKDGEWVEIYNPDFERAVTLRGCVLHDGGLDRHTIEEELSVAPRGFAVLAASAGALGEQRPPPGYVYSGFALSNSADELLLSCGGQVIDAVVYGGGRGFPSTPGASVSLDPAALDARANDQGQRWCAATSVYRRGAEGQGERGTPGALNDRCAGAAGR